MTPDVDVLVAASRSDHPHHAIARPWLDGAPAAAANGVSFTLMPMPMPVELMLASLLRLVTSPKIFQVPTPTVNAVSFIDAMWAMPNVQLANLGPEWPKLKQLCLDKQLSGNDLPDAWMAAAVDQRSEHLVSFDPGFKRPLARSRFTLLTV